jgi:hypothetical protein
MISVLHSELKIPSSFAPELVNLLDTWKIGFGTDLCSKQCAGYTGILEWLDKGSNLVLLFFQIDTTCKPRAAKP